MNSEHSPEDLEQLYRARFAERAAYREEVWAVLSRFFSRWIPPDSVVLDLGCGWCEFINSAACQRKFGMDLNPDAKRHSSPDVVILQQDCSDQWAVEGASLDVVFTSNFLEHLPAKSGLERTLQQAFRALKPNGRFIAMGPNIKRVPGAYWDFFDHHLPLTELSLSEVLEKCGFQVELQHARFLPYTMSRGRQYPAWMLKVYLAMPFFWRLAGAQFLVVARKPLASEPASVMQT